LPEVTFAVALWALRLLFLALVYALLLQSIGSLQRALGRAPAVAERGLAYLVVVGAPPDTHRRSERFPLRAVNAIGRDPGNDVVLRDDFSSARHAVISQDAEGWWVEDVGSTNGTFLNGDRVVHRTVLHFGDEIEAGRVRLRFEHA
jgi:hypothetical protein